MLPHHQPINTMIKAKRSKRSRTLSTSADETSTTTTTLSPIPTPDEQDTANCLIMLAQGPPKIHKLDVYQCKTCSRCFSSFQALGGHRASHTKPKLPPVEAPVTPDPAVSTQNYFQLADTRKVSKGEELGLSLRMADNTSNTLCATNSAVKLSKVHACAICGSEFSSGQALGGHMRRHRPIAAASGESQSVSPPTPARSLLCLDLNLPAADEQQKPSPESAAFMFGSGEKTLVFANSLPNSLVDCRY